MVKHRYMIMTFALLLVLLFIVVAILPSLNIDKVNPAHSYVRNVFDQTKVTSVDILLDDDDLKYMLENPLEEQYVMAKVVVGGVEMNNVGLRTKGNSSLSSVARDGSSDRYSFKIDFDYYDNDQSLYGLKKLNLNNNFSDSTFMREYLSYELMADMGVAAPANSYMYVTMNGKDWGLYLGVEAIDETFISRYFDDGTGDLYKPAGNNLSYISDDIGDYTGLVLKTNEETSDQTAMIKFLDTINNGGDIESVIDVDEILRYFAVNTALVNLDSYQGNFMHNFYLYEENGVFSILPWDYNMSFGGFGGFGGGGPGGFPGGEQGGFGGRGQGGLPGGGPGGFPGGGQAGLPGGEQGGFPGRGQADFPGGEIPQLPEGVQFNGFPAAGGGMNMSSNFLSDANINFSITSPVSGASLESRSLLNALLSVSEYREQFNQYLEQIANDFFDEKTMQEKTENISSLILPYVERDPTKFSTTEQFLAGVSGESSLVTFAVKRADSIMAQLSGELIVEADTGSGMGGFRGRGNMIGGGGAPPGGNGGFERPGQQPFGDGRAPSSEATGIPNSSNTMLMTFVLIVLLIATTTFAAKYKRRSI